MTTTKRVTVPVPTFELESYLLGEVSEEKRLEIERALGVDPDLRLWLEERKREALSFHRDPRRKSFRLLVESAEPPPRASLFPFFSLRIWSVASVAVAALVLGIWVLPGLREGEHPRTGARTDIHVRGGLSVKAAILRAGHTQLLDSGDPLHPGDRLRLTVDDPIGGYLTILLEEERGSVSIPYSPDELGHMSPGTHLLPDSLKLDAVLGHERIYVIMSDERPDPGVWLRELEAAKLRDPFDHGWLPEGQTRIATFEYEKVPSS